MQKILGRIENHLLQFKENQNSSKETCVEENFNYFPEGGVKKDLIGEVAEYLLDEMTSLNNYAVLDKNHYTAVFSNAKILFALYKKFYAEKLKDQNSNISKIFNSKMSFSEIKNLLSFLHSKGTKLNTLSREQVESIKRDGFLPQNEAELFEEESDAMALVPFDDLLEEIEGGRYNVWDNKKRFCRNLFCLSLPLGVILGVLAGIIVYFTNPSHSFSYLRSIVSVCAGLATYGVVALSIMALNQCFDLGQYLEGLSNRIQNFFDREEIHGLAQSRKEEELLEAMVSLLVQEDPSEDKEGSELFFAAV